ncbi:MAG: DUF1273 family protein [Oscillospiraceae bacterium]|nr:DUF1273 family protein [Oscillospiraceae bacterium]
MDKFLLSEESIEKTAFFTGHRYLPSGEISHISDLLYHSISSAYDEGYRRFFCGCALGFDTLAAKQTLRLRQQYHDIILSLAIPCRTQAEKWQEKDKTVYRNILEQADEKIILSPDYYQGVMLTRNRYMADRSSLCICYLQHMRGGTASTVSYAMQKCGIRIINLAMCQDQYVDCLREKTWNYMYTYPSAGRNAVTAPLRLSSGKKLSMKHILTIY